MYADPLCARNHTRLRDLRPPEPIAEGVAACSSAAPLAIAVDPEVEPQQPEAPPPSDTASFVICPVPGRQQDQDIIWILAHDLADELARYARTWGPVSSAEVTLCVSQCARLCGLRIRHH